MKVDKLLNKMNILKFKQFVNERLNELDFSDKEEYEEYKKDHDIRKGTEVNVGDKPMVPPLDTDDSDPDHGYFDDDEDDDEDSNAPMVPPLDNDDSEGDR